MENGRMSWSKEQLDLLDDFLMGFTEIESQTELSEIIGKPLNAVKIRISRRKRELGGINKDEMRKLTIEEYLIVLSNRFDKTTEDIASIIGVTEQYLEDELDEIDCIECIENLEDGFATRIMSIDEARLISKLLVKGRGEFEISHILNRPIDYIRRLIKK